MFVDERVSGTNTLVNTPAESLDAYDPDMPLDGQWVAHLSSDDDLAGDTNGQCDVYLTEAGAGVTTIASIAAGGGLSDGSSCRFEGPSRSANGDYISFLSRGPNLVAGDTNGTEDIFIRTNGPTGQ